MANIDIEKKEGGSVWPWILGLLLLVAVLAFVFWPHDNDRDNDTDGVAATEQVGTTDATDNAAPVAAGRWLSR